MMRKLFMVSLLCGVMCSSSIAEVLFEEDFGVAVNAVSRFDATESLGWVPSPIWENGFVTLKEWSGGTCAIRTNASNNFTDNGISGPVRYSVVIDRLDASAGGVFNSLYARLGSSGFADGYQVRYYCDSNADASTSNASLTIFRVLAGVKTQIYASGTMSLAPVTFAPTELSLTLENTAGSVDYSVRFGSFSCSGSDTSADRVTSGFGVGVELMSNGGTYYVPTDYKKLKVELNPEPLNVLFEESFETPVMASARFDKTETLGWVPSPAFAGGVVTLKEYAGGHTSIRTNAANNFVDDGLRGPVVYSVLMNRQEGNAGGVFNSLYARLDSSGFGSGYQLRVYCDSNSDASYSTGSIVLFRSGVQIFSSGTLTPMPAVFEPTELSLTLENKAGSVDWAIQYGNYSAVGSDTSVDRIESGVGVGCYLMSNGGAYFVPTDFDDLKVEVVPAAANIIFKENFTNSTVATARFDITENLGWAPNGASFHDGVVTLQEYSGGTVTLRTNVANNFVEDGSAGMVLYSVMMDREDGASGSVLNSLYARLGESGFNDGYQVKYFCDSTASAGYSYGNVTIYRIVAGAKTEIYSSGDITLAPVTFAPTQLVFALQTKANSVDYAVRFGQFYCSGSDTSVDRIESGVGVGVEHKSNGGAYYVPTDYDDLTVEVLHTCGEVIANGLTMPGDVYTNCYVDLLDFAVLAHDWMECMDPDNVDCAAPWN